MDGRRSGALLLVGLAVAGAVVHGVTGRAITGTPLAAFEPAAPVRGACVMALSSVPSGAANSTFHYPYAAFGSCAVPVIGEVLAVDQADHRLAATTIDTYQEASSLCELAEVAYVGSIGPVTIAVPGIAWKSEVTVQSLSIAPTPLQRAAGQRWTACVGATRDRSTYTGTLRRALTVGTLPAKFATCWRSLVSSTELRVAEPEVDCSQPHAVEVLALTQITDPAATPDQIATSCRAMASRTMHTPDPTVGGQLRITAFSMDGSSVMPVDRVNMLAGFTGCVASVPAPSRLAGTVIGLGSKPLPLAG